MCGRYTLHRDPIAILKRLRARAAAAEFVPRYNIAPTTRGLAIVNVPERDVRDLRFGLEPHFAQGARKRLSTFNARSETVTTSPLYGPLVVRTRCIVLADGYYEWPATPGADAAPVYVFRRDGQTIAFAGLWDGDTMSVITTEANETIAAFHDRMPVALDDEHADAWLAPGPIAPGEIPAMLRPSAPDVWSYHHVDRAVGNPRNEGPELIAERVPAPSPQLALFSPND
jgi:putative SOS response-associated peptidase YedK